MLNAAGEVANFINATQFGAGHNEFACGPFAVAHVKYATAPNVPNTFTQSQLQQWAFAEYVKYLGPDVPSDIQGSSIDNMHQFFHDASLHWYDMPISAATSHTDDLARIRIALTAGYPVVATVAESSIFDIGLNKNPYWWGPSGTHLIVYSGIKGINFLCQDTANVVGALQGANWAQPGPREYLGTTINNSWASIIQTSWLLPIPSGDPLIWPKNFDAQIQTISPLDAWLQDVWNNSPATRFNNNVPLPITTGIANAWRNEAHKGVFHGSPLGPEYHTKSGSSGLPVIAQDFTHSQAQWYNGVCTFI